MTNKSEDTPLPIPHLAIHVVETGARARRGGLQCRIGKEVEFTTVSLESYFFARWEPRAYDALLVAAAVEFADKTQHRPRLGWSRDFNLHIPVHEPDRWTDREVADSLRDVLDFLTGDRWHITFYARKDAQEPAQGRFSLNDDVEAVIPFSNGLDSRAVAGLLERQMGNRLVRVRLGSRIPKKEALSNAKQPFTSVPYFVHAGERRFVESSARSRGFKFALISGLAAFLANAPKVIVPESGQGAIGPTLVTVGHAYEDYRSHPLFTRRMERFLQALLGHAVRFSFPQLWNTKAETLRKFIDECPDDSSWVDTRSCWQQNRQVSVDGKRRQCGICAACMLRRLSIHAAGLREPKEVYVWEDLTASHFRAGAASSFSAQKKTAALREYAIAGALHLDHLAALPDSSANAQALDLSAFHIAQALSMTPVDVRRKLDRMLRMHGREWRNFMTSLGQNSFLAQWALSGRS